MRQASRIKRKLLFIAPTGDLKAGGEISNLELIKAAAARGYDVHVVIPMEGELAQSFKKLKISYSVFPYGWWMDEVAPESSLEDMAAVGKICEFITKEQIDCVITNTLNVPWGAFASALTNKPHTWIAREFPINEFGYLANRYDYIQGLSNLVIANSKNVAEDMRNKFGVPAKHFYSFVDASGLKLRASGKKSRLVNVGHIYPRKNQLELVEAIIKLKASGGLTPDVLFIGHPFDDAYYKEIKQYIKRHGLTEQVKFKAFTPRPFSLIGPNDIFVQTSKSESIGRTTTEAMKLGLVCVGSDIPGIREAFKLGGGTLYKSGNPNDLAKKLRVVINNPKKYEELANKAQRNALKNMSAEACHDPFFRELDKVIDEPNPQKILRHIAPYMIGASKSLENSKSQLARENHKLREDLGASAVHIRNIESELQNIKASKAYKSSVRIRKALKRN